MSGRGLRVVIEDPPGCRSHAASPQPGYRGRDRSRRCDAGRVRAAVDNTLSAEKAFLTERITTLGPEKLMAICATLVAVTSCG